MISIEAIVAALLLAGLVAAFRHYFRLIAADIRDRWRDDEAPGGETT